MAFGILVPRPGIEPTPRTLEAWSPNHCTTREAPQLTFIIPFPFYRLVSFAVFNYSFSGYPRDYDIHPQFMSSID